MRARRSGDSGRAGSVLAGLLADKGYAPFTGRFEDYNPPQLFERIAMNPPFALGLDMQHVQRAFGMLAASGVLVALMNDGEQPGDSTPDQRAAFAEWLCADRSIATLAIERLDPTLLLSAENLRPSQIPVKLLTLRKQGNPEFTPVDYDSDLRILKRSFDGGGEGSFYLRALERLAAQRHLDWLDIGIGRDGSSLRPFVAACRARSQSLAITGIDPDAEPTIREEDGVRWCLVRGTFQAWSENRQYNVINADQSLYYLGDPRAALQRVLALLRPGGLFIAICWSREDALHRLRARCSPQLTATLSARIWQPSCARCPASPGLRRPSSRPACSFAPGAEDPRFLELALRVIARQPMISQRPQGRTRYGRSSKSFPTWRSGSTLRCVRPSGSLMKKYFIQQTSTCDRRRLDGKRIAIYLDAHGGRPTDDLAEADIVIAITCSTTHSNVTELVDMRSGSGAEQSAGGKDHPHRMP